MDFLTLTYILAILALTVLGLLRQKKKGSSAGSPVVLFVIFFLSVILTSATLGYGVDKLNLVENHWGSRLRKTIQQDYAQKVEARNKNLIIIDGGSWAARGIDGDYLQSILKSEGYEVTLVQLTLPGANHFERYNLHNQFLNHALELDANYLREANVVLLRELHRGYDKHPLAQFPQNTLANRNVAYLSPSNTVAAIRAWVMRMGEGMEEKDELTGALLRDVLVASLINFFQIGRLENLEPLSEIPSLPSYHPHEKARDEYRGMDWIINEYKRSRDETERHEQYAWIKNIKEKRLESLYQGIVDEDLLFTPPAIHAASMHYAQDYSTENPEVSIILPNLELYEKLDGQRFWADIQHLMEDGAKVYTEWLAQQILNKRVLIK